MRYLMFALMIALLPLRGWMGDAMATQMAVQSLQIAQATSSPTGDDSPAPQPARHGDTAMAAGMPADCLNHSNAEVGEALAASSDTACENCSACQACHTVALSPSGLQHAAGTLPGTRPGSAMTSFASAEAASNQKPPIS